MSFLGVHFEVGGKITPACLKLIRIMWEAWNLVRKYTDTCSFRKRTFQYQEPLNFDDVSIFDFAKNQHFLAKIVPLIKAIVWELCTLNENVRFTDYTSAIRLPDRSKLAIYRNMTMTSQFFDMTSRSKFFGAVLFILTSLLIGLSSMLITLLVLELWQFSFIMD